MRAKDVQLTLDKVKLASWVKAACSGTAKKAQSRSGRPSVKALVEQFFNHRRLLGIPAANISAEARNIVAKFRTQFPDKSPPHLSTIRKHMPRVITGTPAAGAA